MHENRSIAVWQNVRYPSISVLAASANCLQESATRIEGEDLSPRGADRKEASLDVS
jgi:hypothetical protein